MVCVKFSRQARELHAPTEKRFAVLDSSRVAMTMISLLAGEWLLRKPGIFPKPATGSSPAIIPGNKHKLTDFQ
jgi:hypothetical protein